MTKPIPWILFVLAFLAVIYLFVLLLDAGIALDSARSQSKHLRERSDLALSIVRIDWIGKEVEAITELARELERQGIIVSIRKDSLNVGDFIFEVQGGTVVGVRYFD